MGGDLTDIVGDAPGLDFAIAVANARREVIREAHYNNGGKRRKTGRYGRRSN